MVDYSSAILKVGRAGSHIDELEYVVFSYLKKQPYRIRMEADFETEKHGYYISLAETPPPQIPTIIGDAVHNLRAALDYLISACAVANGEKPDQTAFPIAEDATAFLKLLQNRVGKAGERAVRLVKDLRPHRGGTEALLHLHKLDIEDKHRAILVVAAAGDFRFRHIARSDLPQVEVNAPIHLLGTNEQFVPSPRGRETEVPAEFGLSVEVVFPAGGPFGGLPCVKALAETHRLVLDIVGRFQKEIP